MAAAPIPRPALSLPIQMAWLDRVSHLQVKDPAVLADLAQQLRAEAAVQGLTVSEAQAVQALADLDAPPPVEAWERPATAADWEGLKATLDAALENYRHATRRRVRAGWGALLGAWLGITAIWAGHLTPVAHPGGSVFLTLALLTALPWVAVGRAYHQRGIPRYLSQRRPAEAALERLRAQLEPAPLSLVQAERFAQVPGLAACLRAIRRSEVPYLALDEAQAQAWTRQFRAHRAERDRVERLQAEEQAINATLARGR